MPLFRKSKPSVPGGPKEFDGIVGRQELAQNVNGFLECAGRRNTDGVLEFAQRIQVTVPGDRNARASTSFFEDPWRWMAAVAQRTFDEGDIELPAKIGLVCTIWHRLLEQEPRLQLGRLVAAPAPERAAILSVALRSLHRMDRSAVFVAGPSESWTVVDAIEQIGISVSLWQQDGTSVPEELSRLAAGDAAAVDAAQGAGAPNAHVAPDPPLPRLESDSEGQSLFVSASHAEIVERDPERALALMERAARLGYPPAMLESGRLARELGNFGAARYWLETSANSGDPVGMVHLALLVHAQGDLAAADAWLQRAGKAGNAEAYAALTDLAEKAGDKAGAQRWARIGASADQPHPYCLTEHGYFLWNEGDKQGGLNLMEQAGQLGDTQGMVMAGSMHYELGNRSNARYWLTKAHEAGDERAADTMQRMGIA